MPALRDSTAAVYVGRGRNDISRLEDKDIGAKAYGLVRMDQIGLRVPPAFVFPTQLCREYFEAGGALPEGFTERLGAYVSGLESVTGLRLGSGRRPLVLAVRSGAPTSMPGMMETILNVGLNDRAVHGLIRLTGNPRLAWDCYRRLIQDTAEVVYGSSRESFAQSMRLRLEADRLSSEHELDSDALAGLTRENLALFASRCGHAFPQDPIQQLTKAIEAVLRSWRSTRAEQYRELCGIDEELGTAVIVQAMVYGNAGAASGAGVGFTRNPTTGDNEIYVDFLFNAQGEDLVSGRHASKDIAPLRDRLPSVYEELHQVKHDLEAEFKDLQDFEFTVQDGRLYMLQTRDGKRTPWAALRVAVDLVEEGLIDEQSGLDRLAAYDLDSLERIRLIEGTGANEGPIASAIPAGIGVAVGAIVLDPDRARVEADGGTPVVLVRSHPSTDDVAGIAVAEGMLTAAGGRTSHAAVVARHQGKTCLVGCSALRVDYESRRCWIGDRCFVEGDHISLDGDAGHVYAGRLAVRRERPVHLLARVARWREAATAPVDTLLPHL